MFNWKAPLDGFFCEPTKNEPEPELNFQGFDGSTSLKSEISGRIWPLNDAAAYREARRLLMKLGGAEALMRELVFSGYVDPDTYELTLNAKPFNIFAQLSAGEIKQPGMANEQKALGAYADQFCICSNKAENDLHWDSQDPKWFPKASFGRRHRFLTTKDLHWQWFNALTFGLVPPCFSGCDPRDALKVVEDMKAAALHFAENIGGWSKNIGLFLNVFGHNNVNSLFLHVVDMEELGPSFDYHSYKNCPLDAVLKVLREEAVQNLLATPAKSRKSILLLPGLKANRQSQCLFRGTDGATSVKAELVARIPALRDASGYREARRMLQEELGGWEVVYDELQRAGFVDVDAADKNRLTTALAPFNVFARIADGQMKPPGFEEDQTFLGTYSDKFMVCSNRPENDEHWDSDSPDWIGKASMSLHHKFLTSKDLHWQWFNALTIGLVPQERDGANLETALSMCELMKAAALEYAAKKPGWSEQVGLFFHVFGHNSVNSMHLHILDMSQVGPTFWKLEYKNCPMDSVLRVLREEVAAAKHVDFKAAGSKESKNVADAAEHAAAAAASASETTLAVKELLLRHSRSFGMDSDGGRSPDMLMLNVGGEQIDVARTTMLVAPKDSLLSNMFCSSWDGPALQRDLNGRIFLNYPPVSFKVIMDHLRLLDNTHPSDAVDPVVVLPGQNRYEIEELSWLLGVGDLCCKPQKGFSPSVKQRMGIRPQLVEQTLSTRKTGFGFCSRRAQVSKSEQPRPMTEIEVRI